VLYEMLAGQPPHLGGSAQQIIMKIITEPARPVTELRKSVPPNVAAALAQALEKLPADRFDSAQAFAGALGDPGYRGAAPVGADTRAGSRRDWRTTVALPALALAVLASVIGAAGAWSGRADRASGRAGEQLVMSSLMPPADERWLRRGDGIALSPDGRTLAVVVLPSPEAAGYLALRPMDGLATQRLRGTEGARFPFWSPDGQSLGFFAQGQLKRLDISSGAVRSLCVVPGAFGGSWSSTGEIIYAPLINGSPWRVSADGGECTDMRLRLASLPVGGRPYFLGDGRHFILAGALRTTLGVLGEDTVSVLSTLRGGQSVLALPDVLISPTAEGVMAQRIDVAGRRLLGEPTRILDLAQTPNGYTTLTASATGSLVVAGPGESLRNLIAIGRRGSTVLDTVPIPATMWTLRASRRGDRLVLAGFGIALYDLATRTTAIMPASPGGLTISGSPPTWGPGDTTIVFTDLLRVSSTVLFGVRGETWNENWQPRLVSERFPVLADWSGDSRWLLYAVTPGPGAPHHEIWLRDAQDGTLAPLIVEARDVGSTRFSPDGRFISHVAMVNDESQVYIRQFPGPGPAIRVSAGEGSSPRWRGDARELFYTTTDRRVMAVPIAPDGTPGTVTVAFENDLLRSASEFMAFDVLPDGQRMVFALGVGGSAGFTLIQNWPSLMTRREARP
jgi:eukaryotic-like serine/threonine-protein kinase